MKFQGLDPYMFSYYLQKCEGTEAFVVFLIHGNCYLCALSCEVVLSYYLYIYLYIYLDIFTYYYNVLPVLW